MHRKRSALLLIIFIAAGLMVITPVFGQDYEAAVKKAVDNLVWRNIGPANMGGRIDDFAVVESNPFIIYCATASGGVWKTTNNGVTWKPIFDDQATSTIGDIAVAPSNPEILWVGTGESNNRQSTSWGNGVYMSTDGGSTWMHMGLEDTHHIGRVVIDPVDPDIVFVAAAGHLWGSNEERGVFKTTDGGETWRKVLYVDENTGCNELVMDPSNNMILYTAAYQRQRRGWGFVGSGPGSAIYKSVDGGETWTKLVNGLPEGDTGRIGLDVFRRDPNIVYAVIENSKGGIFRSEDKGETWKMMSDTNPRPMYYSQIRIDPNNDQRLWVLGARMYTSYDGGKTFLTDVVQRVHGDHHAMWINPENSNHMVLGSDGGIYFSYDKGLTWDFVCTIPLGQFYEVGYDFRKPYNVYGGLQDNGSWAGPSATRYRIGITNADWVRIGGGDGFYTQVDPDNQDILYVESQNGNLRRMNLLTKETKSIRPTPATEGEVYRFNWNSPVLISPHNSKTIYYGGSRLFKSTDMGDTWTASPDLTKQLDRNSMPIMGMLLSEAGILSRNDGISFYGDIITIAESPVTEGILWVGTDDGNVQLSRDGGVNWTNLTDRFRDVPENTYVSRVIASHFSESRAYVTFDGHRNNDFTPYIFVTEDFGRNWKPLTNGIPHGSTANVIREHHRNSDLLFVGTERGAYFSVDRGENWIMFGCNLPMVPVDDIAIHTRENDLIFGTHGRSVYILDDITSLEKFTQDVINADSYLFPVRPAERFQPYNHKGSTGYKMFIGPNPEFGAIITYYLKSAMAKDDKVAVSIIDNNGNAVRKMNGTIHQGLNRIAWDLRYESPVAEGRTSGPFVVPGDYTVELNVNGKKMTETVTVELDPRIKITQRDLVAQCETALTLSKMYGSIAKESSVVRDLMSQMDELEAYLKKVGKLDDSVMNDIKSVEDELSDLNLKLNGERGRRDVVALTREISGLYSNIVNITAAPKPEQLEAVGKISEKHDRISRAYNNLITNTIPAFNQKINSLNIPVLIIQK